MLSHMKQMLQIKSTQRAKEMGFTQLTNLRAAVCNQIMQQITTNGTEGFLQQTKRSAQKV